MKTIFPHGRRLPAPMAAILATAALCLMTLDSAPALAAAPAAAGTLTVAMHYVVPPFVGGSKVRTPEAPDTDLAEALAGKLHATLHAIPLSAGESEIGAAAATGAADNDANANLRANAPALPPQARAALISLPDGAALPATSVAIPTDYISRPMAIMRSDTDIKSWEQLKGRTVCLSEGGLYVGRIAAQYGAIEKVFKAPADALLTLRTGGCDATVHDELMLDELLKLPEWKKFSARLNPGPKAKATLAFVAPAGDTEMIASIKDLASGWRASQYLATLNKKRVRDIAFEVYLDQVVPDCH